MRRCVPNERTRLRDPGVLRAQLALLNRELEDGDISLEEFEREE
ncbi:gas vesicle protein GvpG, partial [Streptomyces sp. NPDC002698]